LHSIEQTQFDQKRMDANYSTSGIRFQVAQVLHRDASAARIKWPEIKIIAIGADIGAL
jgi:hypothetical protein